MAQHTKNLTDSILDRLGAEYASAAGHDRSSAPHLTPQPQEQAQRRQSVATTRQRLKSKTPPEAGFGDCLSST